MPCLDGPRHRARQRACEPRAVSAGRTASSAGSAPPGKQACTEPARLTERGACRSLRPSQQHSRLPATSLLVSLAVSTHYLSRTLSVLQLRWLLWPQLSLMRRPCLHGDGHLRVTRCNGRAVRCTTTAIASRHNSMRPRPWTAWKKRLGLAVSSYERLASTVDDAACRAEARRALHSDVASSLQPASSVVSRYRRGVAECVSPGHVDSAIEDKGSSPVLIVKGVGPKVYEQLPGGSGTPVREAVELLRAAANEKRPSPKLNLLERFLEEVDDLPEAAPAEQPANSVLLQLLRGKQQRGGLRLLSWNCKMMNTTDLRDGEWARAIEDKTARLAALAAAEAADLICVQECPGPQLRGPRASGKARAVAVEERFPRRLRERLDDAASAARHFEAASVAVHQIVCDEVTGEAHPLVCSKWPLGHFTALVGYAGLWVALRIR